MSTPESILNEMLRTVGSAKADVAPVRVTQKFLEDFAIVSRYYMLDELGEVEEAKAAARRDIEAAKGTYDAIAHEIEHEESISGMAMDGLLKIFSGDNSNSKGQQK